MLIPSASRRRPARRLRPPLGGALMLVLLVLPGCAARTAPVTGPPAPSSARPASLGVLTFERGPLAGELDPLFGTPPLATAVWSVLVQSLDTGEVLYRLNPDTLVMPASNQKIVTTAIAATRLGWDFRFETRLETAAPVVDGVLTGDLYVVGNGDPTINAREKRVEPFLDEVAAALREAGIRRIEGRLVGDDDAFDEERFGEGWQWDDFAFGYSAPIGPLQINENTVELAILPGPTVGAPATVEVRTPGSDLTILNKVVTAAAEETATVTLTRLPGQALLEVAGRVPLTGRELLRTAAVDNPTLYFVGALRAGLLARGIDLTAGVLDIDDLPAAERAVTRRVIARLPSPPLAEFAKTLMKVSQNLYAETTMRALSLSPGPASMEASRRAAEQTLTRWGVAPGTYVVADGSGLSRLNYVSATMIMAILRHMARDPAGFETFLATMPVAGRDGTLASRMRGTRAEANVRAKTGTIANVRSLSGYLTTLAGERLAFAMIANNFTVPSSTVDAAVEAALERLIAGPSRAVRR